MTRLGSWVIFCAVVLLLSAAGVSHAGAPHFYPRHWHGHGPFYVARTMNWSGVMYLSRAGSPRVAAHRALRKCWRNSAVKRGCRIVSIRNPWRPRRGIAVP